MNKRDRRGIAAAFRAAKALLWNGRGQFKYPSMICAALWMTDSANANEAAHVIRMRLGNHLSVEDWLCANGIANRIDDREAQAYRHRWLDALIAEFEDDEHANR